MKHSAPFFEEYRLFGKRTTIAASVFFTLFAPGSCDSRGEPGPEGPDWKRHVIDDSSQGADGVRLMDTNGDNLPDITTGWEEGGVVRVYLNPGSRAATLPWPAVTVGNVASVEDAVFVDLDRDGATDVVSSCEGSTRTVFVHWAPQNPSDVLKPESWTTQPIPVTQERMQWMFCLPFDVDGKFGMDLIVGAKGPGAQLGWLESPADPRNLGDWTWHPICPVGWVMSIEPMDMDADGDLDIVVSDRRGGTRGCFWLENRGADNSDGGAWARHTIGGSDDEVMFLSLTDLDGDGLVDCLVPAKPGVIRVFRRLSQDGRSWQTHTIPFPAGTGRAKAVATGDVDLDGDSDLVITCEGATPPDSGVFWLENRSGSIAGPWKAHEISGPEGIKYDLARLIDLDEDGDLDVLTCEERTNLGVIWYENPARKPR
jgi:hypothetical protein